MWWSLRYWNFAELNRELSKCPFLLSVSGMQQHGTRCSRCSVWHCTQPRARLLRSHKGDSLADEDDHGEQLAVSSDLAHGPRKPCTLRAGDSPADDADDYGAAESEQDDWDSGDDYRGTLQTMTGRSRGPPGPTRLSRSPGQQVSSRHVQACIVASICRTIAAQWCTSA